MKKQIEVELRANFNKTDLKKIAGLPTSKFREHDIYYKLVLPVEIDWIIRIRRKDNTYYLTFKSSKQFGEGAWSEVNIPITKELASKMHDFLISNNFRIEVEIIKDRTTFNQKNMEVNVDNIKGLGIFIEAEIMADEDKVTQAQEAIKSYFKSLGIQEESITKKGYVVLMKERLNE